jgi:cobalamin biosynthesis Mg chelatase CobN
MRTVPIAILAVLLSSCATVPRFETPETDAHIEAVIEAAAVVETEAATLSEVVAEIEATKTVTEAQIVVLKKTVTAISASTATVKTEASALVESHEADNARATGIVHELAVVKKRQKPLWRLIFILGGIVVVLTAGIVLLFRRSG